MANYEPTTREVLSEIYHEGRESVIARSGKIADYSSRIILQEESVIGSFAHTSMAVHFYPTYNRIGNMINNMFFRGDCVEHVSLPKLWIASLLNTAVVLGQLGGYAMLAFENVLLNPDSVDSEGLLLNRRHEFQWDSPEYLLIPLATNIASGIYEKVRNTKQKLIQNHAKQGLEDVVDNSPQQI